MNRQLYCILSGIRRGMLYFTIISQSWLSKSWFDRVILLDEADNLRTYIKLAYLFSTITCFWLILTIKNWYLRKVFKCPQKASDTQEESRMSSDPSKCTGRVKRKLDLRMRCQFFLLMYNKHRGKKDRRQIGSRISWSKELVLMIGSVTVFDQNLSYLPRLMIDYYRRKLP